LKESLPAVAGEKKTIPDASRTLSFVCKCGCDLFRVDVETYSDHTWRALIICASCGQWNEPTEPMTNGLH
jgi:hypothetical protein